MSEEELERAYTDLMERLNDFLIGSGYPVHVCIGAMASCITGASAGLAEHVGIEEADREFYSLLNALEKAYAAGTEDLRDMQKYEKAKKEQAAMLNSRTIQ